jgi:phosphate transport system permease protein
VSDAALSRSTLDTAPLSLEDLRGSSRRNGIEQAVRRLLGAASMVSVVITALIVGVLLVRGLQFLGEVEWSRLLEQSGWFPRSGRFDLVTIITGSFWVTLIALAVATPLGVGAAVFLSEYASTKARRVLKPVIEVVAGLPSVVVAFFILATIYPAALSGILDNKYTLLAAGLGVGILTIPIIATITEDALAAVPGSLREASVGLGARKLTTSVRIVLPAAVSGIIAGLIVGASRALGETMLVTLVAGGAGGAPRTLTPVNEGLTMTSAMANLAKGTDNVAVSGGIGLNPIDSLYLVGLLLLIFTMGLNLLGDRIVRRFRQSY